MKPSEIISLARRQTWCTEDIVSTDEAYKFLNFIIEDFWADIRSSDSWFGFDTLDINVISGQATYPYQDTVWDISQKFPISKIQSVWLLDQKTWKWHDLPVHFVDKVDLNKRESQKEPLACFITRDSLNLIPTPKESTVMQVWGFEYNWELQDDVWYITVSWVEYERDKNMDVADASHPYWRTHEWTTIYTNNPKPTSWSAYSTYNNTATNLWAFTTRVVIMDSEHNIWIPKRWHYVIVEGMKYWMYWNMWVNFEWARNNSRAFYDSEKDKAIQNIMDRWQLSDTAYFPNLNYLNY